MDKIIVKYDIGPQGKDLEVAGTWEWEINHADENFVLNIIRKAIKRIKLQNETIIVGLLDVFVNDKKTHEIGILGVNGKPIKTEIKKI